MKTPPGTSPRLPRARPQSWEIAACAVLSAYFLFTVYPLFWILNSSLKTQEDILLHPFTPELHPARWQFDNFSGVWQEAGFGAAFWNSAWLVPAALAGILLLGAPAAYALSRFTHRWAPALFWSFLAGLMIPAQLGMVPLFFQMKQWGLLHSLGGLLPVYIASGLPFAVFILAGFFRSLPKSLHEAALLDGCSEIGAFRHVMLPLAGPGLATVAIFQFIILWKEYFYAFLLLSGSGESSRNTLPLALANLSVSAQYETDYGLLFAGLALVTLPMIALFLLLHRHLIRGVTAGALKG